ncbi:hypothetical protein ACLOJK_020114 [Asimina triloba]
MALRNGRSEISAVLRSRLAEEKGPGSRSSRRQKQVRGSAKGRDLERFTCRRPHLREILTLLSSFCLPNNCHNRCFAFSSHDERP